MAGETAAVVIGAGGGIGAALVAELVAASAFSVIHALSRSPIECEAPVASGFIDVTEETSIAAAAARVGAPIGLVIVATGLLHEAGRMPEKSLRDLDGAALARMFEINTIGPALVLKHFAPLLVRDQRAVIAVLSARVGSISDNRSGGWYGYRASKAALNMVVRSAAIEVARVRPQAICVALHPGTVATPLSEPFQARVPPNQLFTPRRAAAQLIEAIGNLQTSNSGRMFAWDGREIAP